MFEKINRVSIEFTKNCNFRCIYCHQDKEPGFINNEELSRRIDFINKSNILGDINLDIALTGGEVTIYPNEYKNSLIRLKNEVNAENKQFTMMSNMTNVNLILGLIEDGTLKKDRVGFSWDGFNNSDTRVSKFDNRFFELAIKNISNSKYKNDIAIQIAVTPVTLNKLYDTIEYLYSKNVKNLSVYLINGIEYSDDNAREYDNQLKKISELFIKSYISDEERLRFYAFQKCFRDYIIRNNNSIYETTKCMKIGQTIHIDMDGDLYPCIYFGDHKLFKIGDINNGIDNNSILKFNDQYNSIPECVSKQDCKIKHCLSCPAVQFQRTGNFNDRDLSHCKMKQVEMFWFEKIIRELDPYITDISLKTFWGRAVYDPT